MLTTRSENISRRTLAHFLRALPSRFVCLLVVTLILEDYILGRAKRDEIEKYVRLYHNVSSVVYDATLGKFIVKVMLCED
jgi:hypothetical protein